MGPLRIAADLDIAHYAKVGLARPASLRRTSAIGRRPETSLVAPLKKITVASGNSVPDANCGVEMPRAQPVSGRSSSPLEEHHPTVLNHDEQAVATSSSP